MSTFRFSHTLLPVLALIFLAASVSAEVPQKMSYQGRLTDAAGEPVTDGSYQINFKIYGSASGDDSLWSSGSQMVDVSDGLFSYELGSSVTLPHDLFTGFPRYLGITVGADPELSPRTELTSSGFTFQALRSDTTGYAKDIADDIVTSSKIVDDAVSGDDLAHSTIEGFHLQDGTITFSKIGPNDATDGQVMKMMGGNWNAGDVGDITSVYGTELGGLVGGGEEGDVGLAIEYQAITSWFIQDGAIMDEDVNSSADIEPTKIRGTAVNLNDDQLIEGYKTFENLNIGTTTRRLSINSAAFVPASNTSSYLRGTGFLRNTTTGGQLYYANVSLPDGATVTDLKATFYDNDATYSGSVELIKIYMYSGGEIVMAGVSTTGSPGYTTVTESTIISETISNDGYNYYLIASMQYGSNMLDMRLYGAEIVYTVTRPLP